MSQTDLYSDAYFIKTRNTLRKDDRDPIVTMQVFQRKDAILCGLREAMEYILHQSKSAQIQVIKKDGDEIRPWETIMHITGRYREFAALETQYLGILARGTLVATNTRRVVEAARGKPIFFMGSRHTHWRTQKADGYAATVGGASYLGTDASGSASGDRGMGTMPHSFIAVYGGDMFKACQAFARNNEGPVTALVDFNNDVVYDSLVACEAIGDRLAAVRLDTSGSLWDKSLEGKPETKLCTKGVCPELVWTVRKALNEKMRSDVKIVVSGGFNVEKIDYFESLQVPVDMYGVGSSILVGSNDYTADIVEVDGKRISKVGRFFTPVGMVQDPSGFITSG